jgi:putative transposase
VIVDYIDAHRDRFGVEPICKVLTEHGCSIAPSTYYAAKTNPSSTRRQRDLVMMPILLELWVANFRVYGARKLWLAARRAGHDIGRDQVARLMRELGIRGARRGRRVFTTRPDRAATRPADLVKRDFSAQRPDDLWVTDLTYVATWAGVAYVCFIVDAFSRRIVGWSVASHMRTDMVLEAVQMAAWQRGTRLDGLRCHSDAGSQGGFRGWSQHRPCQAESRRSLRASAGVRQPRVLRGRVLSARATASSSPRECRARSVPSGKYWRSRPLVFLFVPRCHGLCGSQK